MNLFLLGLMLLNTDVDTVRTNIELLSIKTIDNKTIEFELNLNNYTKKNLLLYNFHAEPEQAFTEESFYCNAEISARPSIVLYSKNMKPIYARPSRTPKDINYKPITDQDLKESISLEKIKFMDNLLVSPAGSSKKLKVIASLDRFQLKSGIYHIKFIYSSGEYNLNMINQDGVHLDMKENNAVMFKGCIESTIMKLVL